MSRTVLEVRDLRREVQGRVIITNLSFSILQGETLFVRGASGVGKSLLLRCLALLDPLQVGATVPVPLHLAEFASLQGARTVHMPMSDGFCF